MPVFQNNFSTKVCHSTNQNNWLTREDKTKPTSYKSKILSGELYQERVSILQFDASYTKEEAEIGAREAILAIYLDNYYVLSNKSYDFDEVLSKWAICGRW